MTAEPDANAGIRLAVKEIADRLLKAVPQAVPLLVSVGVLPLDVLQTRLALVLTIRGSVQVYRVEVPTATLNAAGGRLAVLRSFTGPLEVVAAAWAFGYRDGKAIAQSLPDVGQAEKTKKTA